MPGAGRPDRLAARVSALESLFQGIAETRMRGVPILNPALAVKAVGFEPVGDAALGALVTPWFMNLVWLPAADEPALAVGATRCRVVGREALDFIGAHEPDFGRFEACSLFSPMSEFTDQETALATAGQVLALLRAPVTPAPAPSRRALLFGRPAGAAP